MASSGFVGLVFGGVSMIDDDATMSDLTVEEPCLSCPCCQKWSKRVLELQSAIEERMRRG